MSCTDTNTRLCSEISKFLRSRSGSQISRAPGAALRLPPAIDAFPSGEQLFSYAFFRDFAPRISSCRAIIRSCLETMPSAELDCREPFERTVPFSISPGLALITTAPPFPLPEGDQPGVAVPAALSDLMRPWTATDSASAPINAGAGDRESSELERALAPLVEVLTAL